MAFPNTYTIGITSLGYQVIWSTLAKRDDVDVKRLFTDLSESLHRKSDIFGISLSWELDGPIILNLLEKQGIPIWSDQRKDNDPLVFGGGPVLTANPEPFAPFFDVILLGEGEELIPNFIQELIANKGLSRKNILRKLTEVNGIYIPSLYSPKYSFDGKLIDIEPIEETLPKTIKKQTWNGKNLCHSTVITPNSAWPNIHMVEVVRSCPELCRFCLASYLTLPFRSASFEENLIPAVEKGLTATKRIGLLGASVSQHPEFLELLSWLNKDEFNDIQLSVSSVRASTVNLEMTTMLQKRGCKSLTIAIESGSERLRKLINKKLSEEEIFLAAQYAKEAGLKGLKLYGMVGLPTEEEEDIEATADLMLRLKKHVKGLRLTLGISTFVPKAQTPFQWIGVNCQAKKRLKILTKKLQSNGIQTRPESYGWSIVQALISRSDRRLAPVIESVRKSNNISLGNWKNTYMAALKGELNEQKDSIKANLPSWEEIIFETWNPSVILPWHHLQGGLNTEQLINHKNKSFKENSD